MINIFKFLPPGLFLWIFYFHILSSLNGEQPISVCSPTHPFRLSDNKCANFTSTCIKINDVHCDQLQNACKQCPMSEMTELMLREILRIVNYRLVYFLIAILTLNFVVIFLLILENRFKFITKLCFSLVKKGNVNKYQLIHSRKGRIEFSNLNGNVNKYQLIHSRKGRIEFSNLNGDHGAKFKFEMQKETKSIELRVYGNDNIVKIKEMICKKWFKAQSESYKIMTMTYKGVSLNNNRYLIPCITFPKQTIMCQMDYSVNVSDILVLKVDGITRDTELVQIDKNKKISDLNQILCYMHNCEKNDIFIESTEADKYSCLNNHDLTLEQAKVKDKDRIVAVTKKSVTIKCSSPLDDEDPFDIESSNIECISSIIDKIKTKFKSEEFVLMIDHYDLEPGRFLFQYNIDEEGQISFYRFYDKDKLIDVPPITEKRSFINFFISSKKQIFKAKDSIANKEVAIWKYKLCEWKTFIKSADLRKELRKLKVANTHERFVKVFGLYKGEKSVAVSMESVNVPLKEFLSNDKNRIKTASNEQVIKWSRQIIEGLACLHDHGIIYDNLTMSHVLLDSNENIKLVSINIGKLADDYKSNVADEIYKAPEISKNIPWNIKADVWSYGIVLLEIITGRGFNFSAKNNENINDKGLFRIDYTKYIFPGGIDERFKGIINSCLIEDPDSRISVKELLIIDLLKPV